MKIFKCRWRNGNNEHVGTWTIENRTLLEADIRKMGGELIEIIEETEKVSESPRKSPQVGISSRILNKEDRDNQSRNTTDSIFNKISSGLVKIKSTTSESSLILLKDEKVFCSLKDIYLYEPRAIRVNSGVRVRVPLVKGVSVYTGQGESHPEMRNTDKGTMVITSKRFFYYGRFKNITMTLNKIVQIDHHPAAICLYKEGREKNFYLTTISPENGNDMVTPKGFVKSLSVAFGMETKEEQEKRHQQRLRELGLETFGNIRIDDSGIERIIPLTGEVIKCIIEGSVKGLQ